MKSNNKSREINSEFLTGAEALDHYLKEISWNLRSIAGQADVLKTVILAMKKEQREDMHLYVEDNGHKVEHRLHAVPDEARCEIPASDLGIGRGPNPL